MKKQIKSVVSLFAICAVIALILAFTNSLTKPIIEKNNEAEANAALLEVLPTGEGFEKLDLTNEENIPATVKEAYREKNGGYVFKLETAGYSAGLIIMCGINPDGTVSGAVCLESKETLGYENTFGETLKGKDAAGIDSVATVSGATKTTGAYKSAVKDAINAFINLNGGSADIRTEEEILLDNLSAALGVSDVSFTLAFVAEELSGIDRVYTADNQSGSVYVSGDSFVGVDADGNMVTEGISDELRTKVEAAAALLASSESTSLDLTRYEGLPSALKAASKTQSGNFILELNASGYGINGSYHASGVPIKIKVSMTPEGKIICCQTVSQEETANLGSACGEPSFYTQFNGKTQENYTEIIPISGATVTTDGYKTAILRAFEAVKILAGGN